MADELTVKVRDADLNLVGDVLEFSSLRWTQRWMGVGGWVLDVHPDSRAVEALLAEGAGIVVQDDAGQIVYSGPVSSPSREIGDNNGQPVDTLQIVGKDDMTWIADRVAHPVPSGAAYTTQSHDTRSGVASTVLLAYIEANLGPTAAIVERRVPGLILAADPVVGSSITGQARWQNLLVFLAELALQGSVGVFSRQADNEIVVTALEARDLSASVAFGVELGNLESAKYQQKEPAATAVYVGGQGEGTARAIATAVASGRRVEIFADRRDLSDLGELDAAADTVLAESVSAASLQITPLDQGAFTYDDDYRLGDLVQVNIDGAAIVDRVTSTEVTLDHTGVIRTLNVGSGAPSTVADLFAGLRASSKRLNQLERI